MNTETQSRTDGQRGLPGLKADRHGSGLSPRHPHLDGTSGKRPSAELSRSSIAERPVDNRKTAERYRAGRPI